MLLGSRSYKGQINYKGSEQASEHAIQCKVISWNWQRASKGVRLHSLTDRKVHIQSKKQVMRQAAGVSIGQDRPLVFNNVQIQSWR